MQKIKYFCLVVVLISGFLYWQNNDLTTSEYTYQNQKIPDSFKGFKIVQISDLHNKSFGEKQERLVSEVKKADPDIILITGDIIDSEADTIDPAIKLSQELVKLADVYYVPGNHEAYIASNNELFKQLKDTGINFIDNESIAITKGNDMINLIGIRDPSFYTDSEISDSEIVKNLLLNNPVINNQINILLAHRPELIEEYADANVNLVFSGHAHGGQVRLPFIGGLIAPNQGLFPEYTQGVHKNDNTSLVISRGLGNSIIPWRIFNRPEVVSLSFE